MDVQMPLVDGISATEQIRKWEAEAGRPRLPIIAMTAGAFDEDRQRCRAAGMDDFLPKPIGIDELARILSKWLTPDTAARAPAAAVQPTGAAITPVSDGPDFDEAALLRLFGNDRGLAHSVIRSALDTMPNHLDKFGQAVAAGSWKDAERAAHSLRGVAAQIGGIALARHLLQAETHLLDGGRIDTAGVTAVQQKYALLTQALRSWLAGC